MSRNPVGVFNRIRQGQPSWLILGRDLTELMLQSRETTARTTQLIHNLRHKLAKQQIVIMEEDAEIMNDLMGIARQSALLEAKLAQSLGIPLERLHTKQIMARSRADEAKIFMGRRRRPKPPAGAD